MSSRGEVLSEEISTDSGGMRSNMSFFLEILESLSLDMLDSIFLDWIWPFAWVYFVLVADPPLCTVWDPRHTRGPPTLHRS